MITALAFALLAALILVAEFGYLRTYGCFFDMSLFPVCGHGQLLGISSLIVVEALLLARAVFIGRASARMFPSRNAFLFTAAGGIAVIGLLWALVMGPSVSCEEGWRVVDEGPRYTSFEEVHCRELGVAPHTYLYAAAHEDHARRLLMVGTTLAIATVPGLLAVRSRRSVSSAERRS